MSDLSQLSPELQEIIKANKSLHLLENGKIRCKLSGHEIPCRLDAIEQYVTGKKYKKLSEETDIDPSLYKDHLTPSFKPGQEHLLFCKLTTRHINNTPSGIKNHVIGKKFQRALTRWKECQSNGTEFKPNTGRKNKFDSPPGEQKNKKLKNNKNEDDNDNNDDDKESVDSLSDLYPSADFQDLSLNEVENDDDDDHGGGGDNDVDAMETDRQKAEGLKKGRGVKRKSTDKKPKVLKTLKTKQSKKL